MVFILSIVSFLNWSFKALAQGVHPQARHDSSAWRSEDAGRAQVSGKSFGMRCAVLFLKGDWAEIAHTYCFRSWNHGQHPCPWCKARLDQLFDYADFNALGMPFGEQTQTDYNSDCAACEKHLVLTHRQLIRVRSALRYDPRPGSHTAKGRALVEDLPELGLCKGDRIEPSITCQNIAAIDDATGYGFAYTFWRVANTTCTHHRNPIFEVGIGISLSSLMVDWLHCCSLGVFQHFGAYLSNALLSANAWAVPSGMRWQAIGVVREELTAWYASESRAKRQHTRAQGLSAHSFGTEKKPELNLRRAAEINGFMEFLSSVLDRRGSCLGESLQVWRRGLDAYLFLLNVFREYRHVVPPNIIERMVSAALLHMRCCTQLGVPEIPKHHQLLELLVRVHDCGSPAMYSCWKDESDNLPFRTIADGAHIAHWHARILGGWKGYCTSKKRRLDGGAPV